MSHVWSADLIGSDSHPQAPLFRKELELETGHGDLVAASWRVSAQGLVEASINGSAVSADVLTPGWSSYEWRIRYRTYDVVEQLASVGGPLVLGLALGNGWFRGRLGWTGAKSFYGTDLGVIAELAVEFADGSHQLVPTDTSWMVGPSSVLTDDLYDGQSIDARLISADWQQPGFAGDEWEPAVVRSFDTDVLTAYVGPPVVRHEKIAPIEVWKSPSGKTLIDFGQNLVGWLRFTVRGEAGSTITIRHAEVLEHGELGTRPLRTAKATDSIVLSGGEDHFEPTFTFHGFRYAEVEGWPGELTADDLVAVVVSSDLERIGTFECSDPLLNQLHRNVVWGQRGNFVDVPTDCPQRDERLGWTGDLAVFSATAAYLFDVSSFLRDWLRDVNAEQRAADGLIPYVVPDVLKMSPPKELRGDPDSTSFWSDAGVWVPWALWQAYGDREALGEAWEAMLAHVHRVKGRLSANGVWDTGFQFADWLDPDAPPDDPIQAKADPGVVSTAAYYRSVVTVAEVGRILGHDKDADDLEALAGQVRAAFGAQYVSDDGRVESDCSTVYALAIAFDLLDEPQRQLAGARLAELTAENGYRISTGFAGTPYICDALTATGHLEAAYRLLLERECPSWLYPVDMGATTIWERWDSMLPDGSINPGQMTSFNHYAFGAVADWMHRTVAGLAPAEPGYQRVRVAPQPGGDLTWAKTSLDTPHGTVAVSWKLEGDDLVCEVTLPDGVDADVELPGSPPQTISGGGTTTVRAASKQVI